MYIKSIRLKNFRNYKEQEIILDKNLNVFYGNNGEGKTNILEAIFLCSLGKSFRTKKDKELIQFKKDKAYVEINYEKSDRIGNIKLEIGEKKLFYVNEIKIKKLSDILRKYLCGFI